MDLDPEFPLITTREREIIEQYQDLELDFMATANFFEELHTSEMRNNAFRTISQYSQDGNFDARIRFLAMNYFDRFVSRHPFLFIEGDGERILSWIAICCVIIAAKMMNISFGVSDLVKAEHLDMDIETVLKGELFILNGLQWEMCSITPFSFVDYYSPNFQVFGGFKRQSINEIIIQSQEENYFTGHKPSDIAWASLMVAASIAYPDKFLTHALREMELTPGFCEMLHLCKTKDIVIEGPEAEAEAEAEVIPTLTTQAEEEEAGDHKQAIGRIGRKEEASTSQTAPPKAKEKGEASTSTSAVAEDKVDTTHIAVVLEAVAAAEAAGHNFTGSDLQRLLEAPPGTPLHIHAAPGPFQGESESTPPSPPPAAPASSPVETFNAGARNFKPNLLSTCCHVM